MEQCGHKPRSTEGCQWPSVQYETGSLQGCYGSASTSLSDFWPLGYENKFLFFKVSQFTVICCSSCRKLIPHSKIPPLWLTPQSPKSHLCEARGTRKQVAAVTLAHVWGPEGRMWASFISQQNVSPPSSGDCCKKVLSPFTSWMLNSLWIRTALVHARSSCRGAHINKYPSAEFGRISPEKQFPYLTSLWVEGLWSVDRRTLLRSSQQE